MSNEITITADATFADFIIETEAYPYSKECFELIKECGELQLMEMYIGATEYIREHVEMPELLYGALIVESSGADQKLPGVVTGSNEKRTAILNKILGRFRKIGRTFIPFLKKIIESLELKLNNEILKKVIPTLTDTLAKFDALKHKPEFAERINGFLNNIDDGALHGNSDAIRFINTKTNNSDEYAAVKSLFDSLSAVKGINKGKLEKLSVSVIACVGGSDISLEMPEIMKLYPALADKTRTVVAEYAQIKKDSVAYADKLSEISSGINEIANTISKARVSKVPSVISIPALKKLYKAMDEMFSAINDEIEGVIAAGNSNTNAVKAAKSAEVINLESSLAMLMLAWQAAVGETIKLMNAVNKAVTVNNRTALVLIKAVSDAVASAG